MSEFTGADRVDPPRRKRGLIKGVLIVVGSVSLCCVLGALFASFFGFSLSGGKGNCTPDTQATIEGQVEITFPPSATNIDCGFIFLQGSEAWVRFEMSPADLDTFLSSTYVTSVSDQPVSEDAHFHYNTLFVTDYLYGEGRFEDGRFVATQYILIDISDPNKYVVYFETWFGD